MTASIIDGKAFAANLKEDIARKVQILKNNHNLTPGLAVVLVGEVPASQVYVRNKNKSTKAAGMNSYEYLMDENYFGLTGVLILSDPNIVTVMSC